MVRQSIHLSSFKEHIKKAKDCTPIYFSFGTRKENIIHTQLRYSFSKLHFDLFKIGLILIDSPACKCKYALEDGHHYLITCPLYLHARETMFNNIKQLCTKLDPLDISLLLNGSVDLTVSENSKLFQHVHKFISNTKRFQ